MVISHSMLVYQRVYGKFIAGWCFGTWLLWLSIYWDCHHPNWRTHIFQRGRSTTNQYMVSLYIAFFAYDHGFDKDRKTITSNQYIKFWPCVSIRQIFRPRGPTYLGRVHTFYVLPMFLLLITIVISSIISTIIVITISLPALRSLWYVRCVHIIYIYIQWGICIYNIVNII